jgi:hypothetical protein
MFFFKNHHNDSELLARGGAQAEKRGKPRYTVSPEFRLNASLMIEPGDIAPAADEGSGPQQGWSGKCRLLDCSEQGVRVQLEPSHKIPAGELRGLRLKVEEFDLNVPCRIANISEPAGGVIFGLMLDLENEATFEAYWQLLEAVVLGLSLKPHSKSAKPDDSGYLVEHYASHRPARLSIWRHPVDQSIAAFEFRLKRHLVRAVAGNHLECLHEPGNRPVSSVKREELQLLFSWMVSNLAPTMPQDVRELLLHYRVSLDAPENLQRHSA